jgi:GAF domain-containing protein
LGRRRRGGSRTGLSRRLQRSIEHWKSGRARAIDVSVPSPPELEPRSIPALFSNVDEPRTDDVGRLRAELRNLKRLHEVVHFLASAQDPQTLIPEILDLALSISGFSRGLLALSDPPSKKVLQDDDSRSYSVRLIRGISREERRSPEVRVLRRLLSQALETRQPAFEPDVRHAPCADAEPGADRLALGAAIVLPLESSSRILGAVLLDDPSRAPTPMDPLEVELLKSYARHAGIALARCLRHRELVRKRERARSERDDLAKKIADKEREVEEARGRSTSRIAIAGAGVFDDLLDKPYNRAKRSFLRRYLRETVERAGGDLERAAHASGLTVAKLARLLDLHKIPAPPRPHASTGSDTGHRPRHRST